MLKQYTADIRKCDNDYQSSIHFAHQSVDDYEMAPPYEMQSVQFPGYQWARTAVAEELFASKIDFLDEKCEREEKLEDLLSEVALKDVKVTQLEHKLLLKDDTFGSLEHDISLKDRRRLSKDERVNELEIKKIEYRMKKQHHHHQLPFHHHHSPVHCEPFTMDMRRHSGISHTLLQ